MKEIVQTYLNLIFKIGLIIVLLATLFLFANLTTEFYDTPKFLVLLVFVGLMLVLTSAKFTVQNRVNFISTPFDVPLLLLLVVAVVSTVLSPSPYVALLGHQLRLHGSLVSLVVYILFYFVLTQNLKSEKEIKWILSFCIWVAGLLSLVTLGSYFGLKLLPAPWVQTANFTPTGSSFSTTAILAVFLPVLISKILTSGFIPLIVNSLFLILFGVTIALTGNFATWVGAVLGIAIILSSSNLIGNDIFARIIRRPGFVAIGASLIIALLAAVLSFLPPVGEAQNPLYTASKNFPREIQLGFITSWKISVSAFRDSPFWGTGPATYLFNFTQYKPIGFNSEKFWNIRFDSSFNEYLGVLGVLGGVGLLAYVALTALFVTSAWSLLRGVIGVTQSYLGEELKPALATSGIVFFVILLLHTSTLPVFVIGLLIFASFWIVNLKEGSQTLSWAHGTLKQLLTKIASTSQPSQTTISIEALPSVLLVAAAVLVLFTGFFAGKFILADLHHRNALTAANQNNGILAYNELIASEKLNPYNDLYRTDLAQVNFALANAIAQAKGPTEASPTGTLTDQDKQNIQVLLQQSINEARTATTLSPRSAINWEILGLLYRQIAGVAQNALLFSLDSYGRAIFNDPLNPILRLNVGGVYYTVKNYDLAIRFFTDAINLKPDYANGFYNLSVALRDKGDLNAAIQAAERTLALVDPASPDYKIATDYLADLKAKVEGPPDQPPAATASGALQEETLPKVINLPKPEKIATPEAIKKPSPTPSPQP